MHDGTQYYIGTKQIKAWPETKDGQDGYAIEYPDGYRSWSPKEIFAAAYIPMGMKGGVPDYLNANTITQQMVDDFIGQTMSTKIGEKTTVVQVTLRNGYVITESSSCVDTANYDHSLGVEICRKRAKDKVWMLLGFLLHTARNGVNKTFA